MCRLSAVILCACLVFSTGSFLYSSTGKIVRISQSSVVGAKNMVENGGDEWKTIRNPRGRSQRAQSSSSSPSLRKDQWSGKPLLVEQITQDAANSQFQPYMLILAGLPGSGKSTFARTLEAAMPFKFARVNQDEMKSRQNCITNAKRAMSMGLCVIVDRCNFDFHQRKVWYDLAAEHNYPVDCVVLSVPPQLCIQRCEQRSSHETIQPHDAAKIVHTLKRQWEMPGRGERHQHLRTFNVLRSSLQFNDALIYHLNQK